MSARATGFGYNGRIAQPCDRGFWNLADSYGTCKACGYGLTTAAVGAGKTEADCGLAAGFGNNGGTVGPCPAGVFCFLKIQILAFAAHLRPMLLVFSTCNMSCVTNHAPWSHVCCLIRKHLYKALLSLTTLMSLMQGRTTTQHTRRAKRLPALLARPARPLPLKAQTVCRNATVSGMVGLLTS